MLAAMNPLVCAMLNLAVMLETVGAGENGMLFGCSHKTASNHLKQVYFSSFFTSTRPGKLGTHSIRKGPATFASRFGMPKDWIYWRKIVWDTVKRLMRRGHTSRVAVDMIRVVYGQASSVTAVINAMFLFFLHRPGNGRGSVGGRRGVPI